MASINRNAITSTGNFTIENGEYPLRLVEAKEITTPGHYKAIQFTWEHVGTPSFKINYDNACFGCINHPTYGTSDFDFTVKAITYGAAKLKSLNAATEDMEDINTDILIKAWNAKHPIVTAKVKMGDKYPEIDGTDAFKKYEGAKPVTAPTTFAVNETATPTMSEAETDPFAL